MTSLRDPSYAAGEPSKFGLSACEAAVGQRATLTLTGTIVEAGESTAGAFVKFLVDPRWGFGDDFRLVMDLDVFEVER
jgi:hypothetical protein